MPDFFFFFFLLKKMQSGGHGQAAHLSGAVSSEGKRQERTASGFVSSSASPQPLMVVMLPLCWLHCERLTVIPSVLIVKHLQSPLASTALRKFTFHLNLFKVQFMQLKMKWFSSSFTYFEPKQQNTFAKICSV